MDKDGGVPFIDFNLYDRETQIKAFSHQISMR